MFDKLISISRLIEHAQDKPRCEIIIKRRKNYKHPFGILHYLKAFNSKIRAAQIEYLFRK